jgi:hypothetical protein
MDDLANRFAREMADAISAAVAASAEVQACRERARAEGLEMKVTLEALVGFSARDGRTTPAPATKPQALLPPAPQGFDITANDRRLLRSLKIAADETTEPVD